MKGRGMEVPVVPILWQHMPSRMETARGVAARTEGVVGAVVAEVAPSATVEAITISIISSSGLHSLPHISIISSSGLHSPPRSSSNSSSRKSIKIIIRSSSSRQDST